MNRVKSGIGKKEERLHKQNIQAYNNTNNLGGMTPATNTEYIDRSILSWRRPIRVGTKYVSCGNICNWRLLHTYLTDGIQKLPWHVFGAVMLDNYHVIVHTLSYNWLISQQKISLILPFGVQTSSCIIGFRATVSIPYTTDCTWVSVLLYEAFIWFRESYTKRIEIWLIRYRKNMSITFNFVENKSRYVLEKLTPSRSMPDKSDEYPEPIRPYVARILNKGTPPKKRIFWALQC